MPLTEDQRRFFERIFGNRAQEMIQYVESSEKRHKDLSAMGSARKTPDTPTPPANAEAQRYKDFFGFLAESPQDETGQKQIDPERYKQFFSVLS